MLTESINLHIRQQRSSGFNFSSSGMHPSLDANNFAVIPGNVDLGKILGCMLFHFSGLPAARNSFQTLLTWCTSKNSFHFFLPQPTWVGSWHCKRPYTECLNHRRLTVSLRYYTEPICWGKNNFGTVIWAYIPDQKRSNWIRSVFKKWLWIRSVIWSRTKILSKWQPGTQKLCEYPADVKNHCRILIIQNLLS